MLVSYAAGVEEIWNNEGPLLEHAFHVKAPLQQSAPELVLELGVEGAKPSLTTTGVRLELPTGASLAYEALSVVDATGRKLPSRFQIAASQVRILVDTHEAQFPVHVDPSFRVLSSPIAELGAFGGDEVAVFLGDINADGFADFGIGVPNTNVSGNTNAGEVRIYFGSKDGAPSTPTWTLRGDGAGERFGCGLAAAGDIDGDGLGDFVVGSCGFSPVGAPGAGRVRLLRGVAVTPSSPPPATATVLWQYTGTIAAQGAGSVLAVGDVTGDKIADVFVGLPELNGARGQVLGFKGAATGMSTTEFFRFDGVQLGERMGAALAVVGDVNKDTFGDLLVGAPGFDDSPAQVDSGKAYLFLGVKDAIVGEPGWVATGQQAGARFGAAVVGQGDVNKDGVADMVVGAPGFGIPGFSDSGAIFAFHGASPAPKTEASTVLTSPGTPGTVRRLGASVALGDFNGDGYADLVAGYETGGSASVYLGSCQGLIPTNVLRGSRAERLASPNGIKPLVAGLGKAVAAGGDFNGDGFAELLFRRTEGINTKVGLNVFWDADLDGEPSEYERNFDDTAPFNFDTDGDGCDDNTEGFGDGGTALDNKATPPGCFGGNFGTDGGLRCPANAPIFVAEGPFYGTCVPCNVNHDKSCGGFGGAVGAGVGNACPSDKTPVCVLNGVAKGSCVARCNSSAECADPFLPACSQQAGGCVACDGDFSTGSPAACPVEGRPVCVKEGVERGLCTPRPAPVVDAGADAAADAAVFVPEAPPDLSGCSACTVGKPRGAQEPWAALGLCVTGLAIMARRFARRRKC